MSLDRKSSLLILAACFLWAIDLVVRYPISLKLDFVTIVFFESSIGLLFITPWLVKNKNLLKKLSLRDWLLAIFIGGFGMAIAGHLQTECIQKATPGLFSFFQIFQPIFVIYMAHVFLKERIDSMYAYWSVWVVLSAILIFSVDLELMFLSSNISLSDSLIALSAMMIWGLCTIAAKKFLSKHSVLLLVGLRWVFAFIFSLIILVGENKSVPVDVIFEAEMVLRLLFISLIAGIFSMKLYFTGLKSMAAGKVSFMEISYAVFGMIFSSIYTFENLTFFQVLGAMSFFAFVILFLSRENSNTPAIVT